MRDGNFSLAYLCVGVSFSCLRNTATKGKFLFSVLCLLDAWDHVSLQIKPPNVCKTEVSSSSIWVLIPDYNCLHHENWQPGVGEDL